MYNIYPINSYNYMYSQTIIDRKLSVILNKTLFSLVGAVMIK